MQVGIGHSKHGLVIQQRRSFLILHQLTYTYYGLDGERAPKDTEEVIIVPSVTAVEGNAFSDCQSLVLVTMDGNG